MHAYVTAKSCHPFSFESQRRIDHCRFYSLLYRKFLNQRQKSFPITTIHLLHFHPQLSLENQTDIIYSLLLPSFTSIFFFEQNSLLANFNNMAWTNRNQAYFFLLNYLPGKAFLLQTRPDCVCGHSVNSPRTCPKSRCTSINRQGVHEKCPTNRILKELSTFQKCLLFPVWK